MPATSRPRVPRLSRRCSPPMRSGGPGEGEGACGPAQGRVAGETACQPLTIYGEFSGEPRGGRGRHGALWLRALCSPGVRPIPAPPTNTSPSTATGITMPTTRTEAVSKRANRRFTVPLMEFGCGRQQQYETRPIDWCNHHHALPLQTPAAEAEGGRDRGAGDRAKVRGQAGNEIPRPVTSPIVSSNAFRSLRYASSDSGSECMHHRRWFAANSRWRTSLSASARQCPDPGVHEGHRYSPEL